MKKQMRMVNAELRKKLVRRSGVKCKEKEDALENSYPIAISNALIGSCTNSSYEDIGRAAFIAREAAKKGLKSKVPLMVTPGSEITRATIERDGYLKDLEAIGATVLANACGPCIGQWKRDDIQDGESNTIVSSYNRNFPARNDGNKETLSFIGSPETVIGLALGGTLEFDFLNDTLINDDGVHLFWLSYSFILTSYSQTE